MAYPSPDQVTLASTGHHRPIFITILAVLVILAGFALTILSLLVVIGFLDLAAAGVPDATLLASVAGIAVVVGLVLFLSGIGLWKMRRWAWILAILTTLAGLGFAVWSWNTQGRPMTWTTLAGIGISALIFIYLLAVSKHFGRQRVAA